jgi:uncharacterized 2Fe-2S/4Fe-4S cluster protein (DUF4445 family)
MIKVTIDGKVYNAEKGTLLSSLLMSDGSRVNHPCGGKGICRKCTVLVDGKEELSCQYVIEKDITVTLLERGIIESSAGIEATEKKREKAIFALDIGTTTLALAVVSADGTVSEIATRNNPQSIYGADVISRIEYCMKNGVAWLQKILIDEINRMISSSGATADKMYVSGNTTMLHTFWGEDCSTLGTYPYTPVFLEGRKGDAQSLNIDGIKEIETLPCISSFVGADIVAGISCLDKPSEGKYNLLVDLGTNAEIALVGNGEIICTSAAAGPCFEGVGISCGMTATEGAICEYSENGYKTIGNKSPKGICATGLIDAIAFLLKKGIIDGTGYMENTFEIAENITLTEGDIRQYQLSKSAIYSGIVALMRSNNISFDKIEKLYISGGFSHKINMTSAVLTGLLPEELTDKYECINNSSLKGTISYALGKNDLNWIKDARYEDMSQSTLFSELFIENMSFNKE